MDSIPNQAVLGRQKPADTRIYPGRNTVSSTGTPFIDPKIIKRYINSFADPIQAVAKGPWMSCAMWAEFGVQSIFSELYACQIWKLE